MPGEGRVTERCHSCPGFHPEPDSEFRRQVSFIPLPEFGPFSPAFDSDGLQVPGYLTLLHLEDDDAQTVIDRIEQGLGEGDRGGWIKDFLKDSNWRPHLVAAIAFLLPAGHTLDRADLWAAIDAGSWVTPQLVVTALFADPEFAVRAAERIERHCPVVVPRGLDVLARHSATGPGGIQARSGKMLASLLSLCGIVPALAVWGPRWRGDEQIRALLREDATGDTSDRITLEWMTAVRAQFQKRGIALLPLVV